VVVTTTFTVVAPPTLNFSATSGPPGTSITITGANYDANYPIEFKFDATIIYPQTGGVTSASGTINSILNIPSTASVATHIVYVRVNTTTLFKEFAVTAPPTTAPPTTTPPTTTPPTTTPPTTKPPTTTPPTTSKTSLNIVQNAFFIGAPVGIGGAGFTAGANVTIKYGTTVVATAKAATDTTFQIIFNLPPIPHGIHQFTISDGVNTATTNFTVESTPPKMPPQLKPELGGKAKTPVTFGWTAVIDDSEPVTYSLQVSTDKSFTGTLVLDKTGLDSPTYTLSELEQAKLVGSGNPYYWRVEAIDAASNESGWTSASLFDVGAPFKFPRWGIYLGVIVGALVVFILGLLVGRRTALKY
jgi:hypothetical protein